MTNHKSIRKYTSQMVDFKLIEQALNKAIRASSSGNMQTYSIIVTKDPRVKEKLYKAHFKQDMAKEAPYIITFCADNYRHTEWSKLSGIADFSNFDNLLGFMVSAIDAILVSQNAALAFEELGLGICYMGSALANCYEVAQVLELPSRVIPVVAFSLGYPAENPPLRDRLPLKYLLHADTYCKPSAQDILDCYANREVTGMKRYNEAPWLSEKIKGNNITKLAEVYAKLKYTKATYTELSQNLYRLLRANGYLE